MANFVRRIVSGNKARFRDKHLDLELDLAYVTDNIIVMGFPAAGVEGLYRNRREDAKKFLDHRHGKNYWVFNFCPIRENSYPAGLFDGRVSRYPFPDHHAPPLAILPLFVREAREWLSGSPDRVAVLHCKAGKGRSGTLACAYLLSLDETPSPPKLQRSLTRKEWAKRRADLIAETVESETSEDEAQLAEEVRVAEGKAETAPIRDDSNGGIEEPSEEPVLQQRDIPEDSIKPSVFGGPISKTPGTASPDLDSAVDTESAIPSNGENKSNDRPFTLEDILALHTARRMKPLSSPDKKRKQGVSIPSQRRWLYYWSLLLADAAPRGFWQIPLPRVRLREIRVRMRDMGGMKMTLLKLANHLIEKTNSGKYGAQERGQGPVWVSLARYNDDLVQLLEKWEKHTRSEDGNFGKRLLGSEHMPEGDALRDIFTDERWDGKKMIRSFARLGHLNGSFESQRSEDGRVFNHTLGPLTDKKWKALQDEMRKTSSEQRRGQERLSTSGSGPADLVPSTASSVTDLAQGVEDADAETGVILDAAREVRAKLYMGQVFMGWFWFIPAFHMPPPPTGTREQMPSTTTTNFTRKEVDFHIGPGAALIDIDVALEWVVPSVDAGADKREPPRPQTSEESARGIGGEPGTGSGNFTAGIQAVVSGAAGRETTEAMEASEQ